MHNIFPFVIVTSLTGTPRVNAHKHRVISKRLRELIIEGIKYIRMKCRERGYFINFTKKESGHQKLPLKREYARDKDDVCSPYTYRIISIH
jgi:hypothetical protein